MFSRVKLSRTPQTMSRQQKRLVKLFSIPSDKESLSTLIKYGVSYAIGLSASATLLMQTFDNMLYMEDNKLEQIYKDTIPSIVTIKTTGARQDPFKNLSILEYPLASGSGFVFFDDDHIVTNAHVIDGAYNIKVNEEPADVELVDAHNDIAILKIHKKLSNPLTACTTSPQIGKHVVAIGNPFGLEGSLSQGVISGKDRFMFDQNSGRYISEMLQTDAAINPGNSGGPLLDSDKGCVIGMNTSIISTSGMNSGVGLVIPISKVNDVYNDDKHVSIGLVMIPDIYTKALGIHGIIVSRVVDGSIAEKLGLIDTTRDDFGRPVLGSIITKIDGKIVMTNEDVLKAVSKLRRGDQVSFEVINGDEVETLMTTV